MQDHHIDGLFLLAAVITMGVYSIFFFSEITGFIVGEHIQSLHLEVKTPESISRYSPGELVNMEMRIRTKDENYPIDVILFYSVQDEDLHDISYREDTFAISGENSVFNRVVKIPAETIPGQYYLYAQARLAEEPEQKDSVNVPIYVDGREFLASTRSLSIPIALFLMIIFILVLGMLVKKK